MKEDILKKFVDENRDDFDDQLPDADILGQLQSRLGLQPPVAAPRQAKLIRFRYWRAAAAVITVMIGIGVLLRQDPTMKPSIAHKRDTNKVFPGIPTPIDSINGLSTTDQPIAQTEPQQKVAAPRMRAVRASQPANTGIAAVINPSAPATDAWQSGLQNESSSVRLAAVLASGKNKDLSDNDLKTIYNTMNNDENSNVRLAALDVLKKRERAGNLILASVDQQNDPVVQMELLASLSPAQAVKVEQQLLDITQNPLTIDAVRNEAYAVLLRSNTNFLK